MLRAIMLTAALLMAVPAMQAAEMFDWLKPVTPAALSGKAEPSDAAELLTLEPKENEMYAKVAPDGRMFLAVSHNGRQAWVSRRFAENGDPANVVTDDIHALDSFGWLDDQNVYFLSERTGGLGLWVKAADGLGMVRRLNELNGRLTQPVPMSDGSLIAVRLLPAAAKIKGRARPRRHDDFINWEFPDFNPHIVRIERDGGERVLSKGVNPAVSPDGRWLAFAMPVGRSVHLFRMRVDGSELVQLTDTRSVDVQPTWSPDGKWLVFTSNRAKAEMRQKSKSNWDLWAIDREGRNLTQLTRDPARDGGASVGRDGRVYFHSDRKVSKAEQERHQMKGTKAGFHIWTVRLPSID